MGIRIKETYTTTGAKTAIDTGTDGSTTVVAVGDDTDYTANVEVRLTDDGNWIVHTTGLSDSTLVTISHAIKDVRLNISALGGATTIDFEVNNGRL